MMNKMMQTILRRWSSKHVRIAVLTAVWVSSFLVVILLLPGLLVRKEPVPLPPVPADQVTGHTEPQANMVVPVYLTKEKKTVELPIEQYVAGVVAAEMPIEFEPEALKAQAMAARTFIVRRVLNHDTSNVPVSGAWVTDTIQHQAFLTTEQLKKEWGDDFDAKWKKIESAVQETAGKILTYQHQPIQAFFFSTSNGYTENSEDYWGDKLPYLRSVPSPWDESLSPKFRAAVTIPYSDFSSKLDLGKAVPAATVTGSKVLAMTEGHRVEKIRIAGKTFTGREVREKLGLNSTAFQLRATSKGVEVSTTGYGHGVGMSQWGAQGMAKEGKKADDILKYYYTGIEIEPDRPFLPET